MEAEDRRGPCPAVEGVRRWKGTEEQGCLVSHNRLLQAREQIWEGVVHGGQGKKGVGTE